ncbi:fructose-bisphosphate aldolase, chloroplastic-like isoform X2 [Tasmannia lanceolata]|uniref:fructose-bisphosphate aldolase, chloroplastic-like isoform X2 n=1 Tax=Tasmannia lanceolata TaxID=3420 RepID=UPI004064026E
MASASLLKSSPVLDKSEWVKGQSIRLPSAMSFRSSHTAPSTLTVRAGSYSDEFIKTAVASKTKKREIVIPDPDNRIPIVFLGLAGGLAYQNNLLPAAPLGLLGLLLLFQEVKVGDQLQESGENVFVGGKNRWKYSTFVNWELWWPNFPILVYFKEKQTKPEGQVHFFPVIFNGKQLYDVMVERAGPSKTSAPKQS